MKCEFCDNTANVFYTQALQKGQKKICLCEQCAEERGLLDPGAFSMVDILMDDVPEQADSVAVAEVAQACEACGFTLEDYRKVGRLGCGQCYTAFGGEITPVLTKMHYGVNHEGRVPQGMVSAMEQRKKLVEQKEALAKAIAEEDFEQAAHLRDSIRTLEAEKD